MNVVWKPGGHAFVQRIPHTSYLWRAPLCCPHHPELLPQVCVLLEAGKNSGKHISMRSFCTDYNRAEHSITCIRIRSYRVHRRYIRFYIDGYEYKCAHILDEIWLVPYYRCLLFCSLHSAYYCILSAWLVLGNIIHQCYSFSYFYSCAQFALAWLPRSVFSYFVTLWNDANNLFSFGSWKIKIGWAVVCARVCLCVFVALTGGYEACAWVKRVRTSSSIRLSE